MTEHDKLVDDQVRQVLRVHGFDLTYLRVWEVESEHCPPQGLPDPSDSLSEAAHYAWNLGRADWLREHLCFQGVARSELGRFEIQGEAFVFTHARLPVTQPFVGHVVVRYDGVYVPQTYRFGAYQEIRAAA